MSKDRKFLFDANIFDAPSKDEAADLPPPPPTFSEEELAVAKDMAFEQGRQQGQKEQTESREQAVALCLDKIAKDFSRLFASETVRESIFEKESLRLSLSVLDLLYPSLSEKIGRDDVYKTIEKTLVDHRKTKEILIKVSVDMRGEVEALISRIRAEEHEEVLWRVVEDPSLQPGDCSMEWSDGGAIRDTVRTARDIRKNIETLLGEAYPVLTDLELASAQQSDSDVSLRGNSESGDPETAEKNNER